MTDGGDEDFDHYDEAAMGDPFALYRRLRLKGPVSRSSKHGGFAHVSSYEGVKRVYGDYQAFTSTFGAALPPSPITTYPIDLDPPEHNAFRRRLNRRFSPEAVQAERRRIQSLLDGLIDQIIEDGSCDLARDVVRPLLPAVVLPLLGVPMGDHEAVGAWVETMVRSRASDPGGVLAAGLAVSAYLTDLVRRRRADPPQEDVLSALLPLTGTFVRGEPVGEEEIGNCLLILLLGGLDTTSSTLLDALLHLSRRPDEARRLRSGELGFGAAVEEFLRLYTPITGLCRVAKRDVALEGEVVRKGERIMAMNGAANRDPSVFPEPDGCRLDRQDNPHLAFGFGAHTCVGRHLARLEIEIVLKTVLERMADFRARAAFTPSYHAFEGRNMKALPVVFSPGRRLSPKGRP